MVAHPPRRGLRDQWKPSLFYVSRDPSRRFLILASPGKYSHRFGRDLTRSPCLWVPPSNIDCSLLNRVPFDTGEGKPGISQSFFSFFWSVGSLSFCVVCRVVKSLATRRRSCSVQDVGKFFFPLNPTFFFSLRYSFQIPLGCSGQVKTGVHLHQPSMSPSAKP